MSVVPANTKPAVYWYSMGLPRRFQTIVWTSLVIVSVITLLDLAGWIFNITLFKSIEPYWIPMKIITAICFIFSGTALVFIQAGFPSRLKTMTARTLIALVALISLMTIIDNLYFTVAGRETFITGIPALNIFLIPENRMSFMTACIFLLVGAILFLQSGRKGREDDVAHILVLPATLASFFVPVSYILDIYSALESPDIPIALNSGIAFFALCAALIMIRPHTWLMRVFASKNLGGTMARRLLPGLFVLPIIIGWLRIYGEHSGLFKSEFGVAIVALAYTLFFILLLWLTARSVNRIDDKRSLYEEALINSYNDLESANIRLNQELAEHNLAEEALKMSEAKLKELNATKDKFFNIVAHDLKNPFTSLLGSTELLYANINRLSADEIRKLAEILNDSAKSGYSILQNLLDWSRSQTGLLKIVPERINLKALIDENISDLKLFSENKEIYLHSDADKDIYVTADRNMLKTIIRNLLSNAMKFTRRYGEVKVSLTEGVNEVIISVKDTGIGIPEDNIEKLFRLDTKFQMPGTEKEQGTGLGLKLCREFVEKQGGKIWAESIENMGSEFKFTVPQRG